MLKYDKQLGQECQKFAEHLYKQSKIKNIKGNLIFLKAQIAIIPLKKPLPFSDSVQQKYFLGWGGAKISQLIPIWAFPLIHSPSYVVFNESLGWLYHPSVAILHHKTRF